MWVAGSDSSCRDRKSSRCRSWCFSFSGRSTISGFSTSSSTSPEGYSISQQGLQIAADTCPRPTERAQAQEGRLPAWHIPAQRCPEEPGPSHQDGKRRRVWHPEPVSEAAGQRRKETSSYMFRAGGLSRHQQDRPRLGHIHSWLQANTGKLPPQLGWQGTQGRACRRPVRLCPSACRPPPAPGHRHQDALLAEVGSYLPRRCPPPVQLYSRLTGLHNR